MALVRRNSLLGQAEQLVTSAVSTVAARSSFGSDVDGSSAPAAGRATVYSGQSAAGATANGVGGGSGGEDAGTATTGGEAGPAGEAAAAPTPPASLGAVIAAFALIAAAGAGSWAIWSSGGAAAKIQPPDTTAVFGVLVVFAAAVERILEPFSRWLPGRRTEAALERSIAELVNRKPHPTQQDLAAVAEAKARVERARGNRTIVAWGIATAVATLASTAGGFYILHAIAGEGWNGLPVWVDGIVTGVMVGSGTKPLHDIISRVQNAKDQAGAAA
ncbi:hypothetical protein AB0J86_35895 [Micromonospora sp. NPDC049559]|uniref:hypothetical protein n=1 Tax=Micromonospora sp. NPDC049559 TaxID=3155923 RepID=UPI003441EAEE